MSFRQLKREMERAAARRDDDLPNELAKAACAKRIEHDLCQCELERRDVASEAERLADERPPQACALCGKVRLIVYGVRDEAQPRIVLAWPVKQEGEKSRCLK